MKVLVCCIGRLENRYIREFVDHYKNLGVTNICLYDNNFDGEEDFADVISDYIECGFVIIKNFRNKRHPQFEAYRDCYSNMSDEYDWIAFFDVDELLELHQHNNIIEFLSDERYSSYQAIHIRWKVFGDNGMLSDNGELNKIRFTTPVEGKEDSELFKISTHVKTIIRTGLYGINILNPHAFHLIGGASHRACTPSGIEHGFTEFFSTDDYSVASLSHYCTKTISEFINKAKKGGADTCRSPQDYINYFFVVNDATKEKVDMVKNELGIDVSHLINTQHE